MKVREVDCLLQNYELQFSSFYHDQSTSIYIYKKWDIAIPELTQIFFHILEYDSFNQFRHDYDWESHEVSRDLSIKFL